MNNLLRPTTLAIVLAMVAPRHALAGPKEDADTLILQAQLAHKAGKFEEALDKLKTAYVLDPRPELLYAIGQLHLGLNQCAAAIPFYERFLSTRPEPGPAWAADQAIQSCKQATVIEPVPAPDGVVTAETTPAAAPAAAPAPASTTRDDRWYSDYIADGLVAGGVVSGVVSLLVYRSARTDRDRADVTTDIEPYRDLIDRAQSKRTYAVVFGIVGAGLVAGGVIRFVLHRNAAQDQGVQLAPTSGGGVVSWTGRF